MDALQVQGLAKRFGAVHALRGVTFSVAPGEVFGYLGPNGAGKTTTLRILTGLVRPSAGGARLLGVDCADARSRRDIGFVPGDLRLHGDMTAAEALDFFARFRPAAPPRRRAELLEALGFDGAALGRRVKFLSHGTRQKVGLVAAMQHDPALLLLDEPTNGLDPLVQRNFRDLLRACAQRGRTVLLSSHVLSEVEQACGRVAILRRGEIVALETIEGLRDKAVRRMSVRFREAAPARLAQVPGVARAEVSGREARLWVRGDLAPLLAALAAARVEDMSFPEAQLEDIFLGYYGESDHG